MKTKAKPTVGRPSSVVPLDERMNFRRVNLTIREDQYQLILERSLSLSALIRDLLDDRFASNKVVLNLSDHGKKVYDIIVGSFGVPDVDLEPFFLKALDEFMQKRIDTLAHLKSELKAKGD